MGGWVSGCVWCAKEENTKGTNTLPPTTHPPTHPPSTPRYVHEFGGLAVARVELVGLGRHAPFVVLLLLGRAVDRRVGWVGGWLDGLRRKRQSGVCTYGLTGSALALTLWGGGGGMMSVGGGPGI